MKNLFFFLKQSFRRPAVLFTALVLMAACAFSFSYHQASVQLPCAVYSEDDSEEAEKFLEALKPYGFEICDSREEAIQQVRSGRADCALIVHDDLASKVAALADPSGTRGNDDSHRAASCCELLVTSRTSLAESYTTIASALLYSTFTPQLTTQAFQNQGYDIDEASVQELIQRSSASMTPLSFEMTDLSGKTLEDSVNFRFPAGCIAIALFLSMGLLSVTYVRSSSKAVRVRLSTASYYGSVILPRMAALALVLGAAAVAGILIGNAFMDFPTGHLIAAVLVYDLLLVLFFSLILFLPVSDPFLITAISLNALLSLALCPLYRDFTLYFEQLSPLRFLSVPYWLYLLLG